MKRTTTTALLAAAAGLCAVGAAPAADHELMGAWQVRGIMANSGFTKDGGDDPDRLVDQRLRIGLKTRFDEHVAATWYGEVDFNWGSKSKGSIGGGGEIAGDGVNVETKHAYADLTAPGAPLSARLGLQYFGDSFDRVLISEDAAGATFKTKHGPWETALLYAKFLEGVNQAEDDKDLYGLQVGYKPGGNLKLGADFFWVNDNGTETSSTKTALSLVDSNGDGIPDQIKETTTTTVKKTAGSDLFYLGPTVNYKLGSVDLSGWAFYHWGEVGDADVSAWAGSVKGAWSFTGGKAGLRFLYFSGNDDQTDQNFVHNIAQSALGTENLMIFLNDPAGTSYDPYSKRALKDAAHQDYGLLGAVLSADYVPPRAPSLYLKGGLGYFAAAEDDPKRAGVRDPEGSSLGTELALRVGYKMTKHADISLNGAYAWLGDFYDKVDKGQDPDNLYVAYLMVHVPY